MNAFLENGSLGLFGMLLGILVVLFVVRRRSVSLARYQAEHAPKNRRIITDLGFVWERCGLTCAGGSEFKRCPCRGPAECFMKSHPDFDRQLGLAWRARNRDVMKKPLERR